MTDQEKIEKLAYRLVWLMSGRAKFGPGHIVNWKTGEETAPSVVDLICDELLECADWKVDRDFCHAYQLPKKEFQQWLKKREKEKQSNPKQQ